MFLVGLDGKGIVGSARNSGRIELKRPDSAPAKRGFQKFQIKPSS
jgi:hypothetical protein